MEDPNLDVYQYIKQMHSFVASQNKKVKILENQLEQIQKEIAFLKKEKGIHIDKIEYKFDQLKVERLEGTLNIGITPNGKGIIDEYDVEGNIQEEVTFSAEKNMSELMRQVKEEIDEYVADDIEKELMRIVNKYNYPLDSTYKQLIIDDIEKQLDKQIQIYINQINNKINDHNLTEIKNTIINKVISDIQQALEKFIQHLPKKEE